MRPETDKEAEFASSAFKFQGEIINALATKVRLTLNVPKNLMCMMQVGASRQVPVSEDEDFRLITAVLVDNPELGPRYMKLRLAPVTRQEYKFADLLLKEMSGFSGTFDEGHYGSWEEIYEAMLDHPCLERPEVSYRTIIDAALASEKSRIVKQSIEAHSEFGTW